MNLGLRYDLQTPMWERQNRLSNFDLEAGSATFGTLVPARAADFASRTFSDLGTKNLAPRVGFAYGVNPATLVRGAFGIFYAGGANQPLVATPAANMPYLIRATVPSSAAASVSNLVLADGFPAGALDPGAARNPGAVSVPRDFPLGEVHQWNVGVERALPGHSELSLTYLGSVSSHLQGFNAVNAPVPGPGTFSRRRPFPDFDDILQFAPFVEASYHALQVKVERRFSRGFALLGSHTWSHAIDNSADNGDTGGTPASTTPQNPADLRAERASASFDVRHRFVTSVIYDLPVGRRDGRLSGARIAGALLGGWQVAGIFVAQSGLPMTPTLRRSPWAAQPRDRPPPGRPDHVHAGARAAGADRPTDCVLILVRFCRRRRL